MLWKLVNAEEEILRYNPPLEFKGTYRQLVKMLSDSELRHYEQLIHFKARIKKGMRTSSPIRLRLCSQYTYEGSTGDYNFYGDYILQEK